MRADGSGSTALFTVRLAQWEGDADPLRAVRRAVFVIEQGIPESLEWDTDDATCVHALAHDSNGVPIGCGRLLADGYIGRMAVLNAWRTCGVGSALLELLVDEARQRGHAVIRLRAQTQALPFYARHGFVPEGPEFVEAAIAHQAMVRTLSAATRE